MKKSYVVLTLAICVFLCACSSNKPTWSKTTSRSGAPAFSVKSESPISENGRNIYPEFLVYCDGANVDFDIDMKTKVYGKLSQDNPHIGITLENNDYQAGVTLTDSRVLEFGPQAVDAIRKSAKRIASVSITMNLDSDGEEVNPSFDLTGLEETITKLSCK